MKAIISGVTGFIGGSLRQRLQAQGHEVIALTHETCELKKPFELPAADIFYHMGANSRVYWGNRNPLLDFETNALGTLHVLEACVKANIRKVVYASSLLVYRQPWQVDEQGETGYNRYGGAYGLSKLVGEQYLHHYSETFGIKGVVFRIASPYGPGMRKNLIYDLVNGYLRREELSLFSSPDTMTDFIYIADLVSALLLAADSAFEGVYNLSSGKACSTLKLVESVSAFFGESLPVRYSDNRVKICAQNDNLIKMNWDIKTDLTKGLEQTINHLKKESFL